MKSRNNRSFGGKKTGYVDIPFTGFVRVPVKDVSNLEEAYKQGLGFINDFPFGTDLWRDYCPEVEYDEVVSYGNVACAVLNDADFMEDPAAAEELGMLDGDDELGPESGRNR